MKKILLSAIAALSISAGAFAQPASMITSKDSLGYAIGMNIGESLRQQGVENEVDLEMMKKGIADALSGKPTLLTTEKANMTLQEKLQAAQQRKMREDKEKSEQYLKENAKQEGVISLPNGLQYKILREGKGPKPAAVDTVVVHYAGTLTNGQEFDNSEKRGQPATFPLKGVIKGWTEILQHMPKGSKWKVWIPSDLGYGDRGTGSIPPGSTLIFDIDLIDVKPAAKK